MLLTINHRLARFRDLTGTFKRPTRALLVLTAIAAVFVLLSVWKVGGLGSLLTLVGSIAFLVAVVWSLRRSWRATFAALITVVALVLVVVTQSMRWAEVNPGTLPLTYLAFVLAAPLGAFVVPVNRGARWLTVAAVGGAMVVCSMLAPLTPQGAMVAALLALFVPLGVQGARRRVRGVAVGATPEAGRSRNRASTNDERAI